MPLYDALLNTDNHTDSPVSPRIVHTRHEAAAVFMAEAHASVSGKPAIALVTAGPGFGNALGALYSASMSEVPVILLSGDSPISKDGKGPFQELDQQAAVSPFVKATFRLTLTEDPLVVFSQAMSIATSGVPGPVHVALPADVLTMDMYGMKAGTLAGENSSYFKQLLRISTLHHIALDAQEPPIANLHNKWGKLAEVLTNAERPLILAGPHLFRGARQKNQALLSNKLQAPIVVLESPRGLRDPAQGALAKLISQADTLIYLGKPIDFTSGFGGMNAVLTNQFVIISDDENTHDRGKACFAEKLKLSVALSPTDAVGSLLAHFDKSESLPCTNAGNSWRAAAIQAINHRQLLSEDDASNQSKGVVQCVTKSMNSLSSAILVCDGGEFGQWSQAFSHADIRLTNGPSGAIGAGLAYAIGAKIARPDLPVFAFMGDGTVGFHLAEFETASREGVDITVVIGNDSRWNAEHHIQVRDYGEDRTHGCELGKNVRYDIAAQGLGCEGILVETINELEQALKTSQATSIPTCINVIIPGAPAPVYGEFDFEESL